jgi:hypothetical protein
VHPRTQVSDALNESGSLRLEQAGLFKVSLITLKAHGRRSLLHLNAPRSFLNHHVFR